MANNGAPAAGDAAAPAQDESSALNSNKMYRYGSRRPAEVEAAPVDEQEYQLFRATTDLREPYRIAQRYLAGTKKFDPPELTEAPLVVFINSRSGGRAGPKLTEVLYQSLGHAQVFDLQEHKPGPVLQRVWDNFAAQEAGGDQIGPIVRSRFRVLAAGGDGTVAWLLKTIKELRLEPPPPVAVMPLGTGNDLSLSFGWGNTFLKAWINRHVTVYETLKRVADSETRDLDAWRVSLTTDSASRFRNLPHSLEKAEVEDPASARVGGLFWNYFSLGLDAQAAYGFHHLREEKPWAASGRLVNQAWYGYFSCATGWFCFPPPISATATLKVRDGEGGWVEVLVPRSVKALVLLNLQSYGGGRDLWGLRDTAKDAQKGWQAPIFNDGLIEVVGLRGGYHTAAVMGGVNSKIHSKRLAQASEVLIELRAPKGPAKGAEGVAHMQLDGEPWQQAIPAGESAQPLTIHIRRGGQSKMLFNSVKLAGIAPKIQKLAAREGEVSVAPPHSAAPVIRHAKPTAPPQSAALATEEAQEVGLVVPPAVDGTAAARS